MRCSRTVYVKLHFTYTQNHASKRATLIIERSYSSTRSTSLSYRVSLHCVTCMRPRGSLSLTVTHYRKLRVVASLRHCHVVDFRRRDAAHLKNSDVCDIAVELFFF